MEWHFCYTDWNCWATWFWSSSTAAWAQALLTIGVIWWSITSARNASREDKEKMLETFKHEISLQHQQSMDEHERTLKAFDHDRSLVQMRLHHEMKARIQDEQTETESNAHRLGQLICYLANEINAVSVSIPTFEWAEEKDPNAMGLKKDMFRISAASFAELEKSLIALMFRDYGNREFFQLIRDAAMLSGSVAGLCGFGSQQIGADAFNNSLDRVDKLWTNFSKICKSEGIVVGFSPYDDHDAS